jgi:hypothetical protein
MNKTRSLAKLISSKRFEQKSVRSACSTPQLLKKEKKNGCGIVNKNRKLAVMKDLKNKRVTNLSSVVNKLDN